MTLPIPVRRLLTACTAAAALLLLLVSAVFMHAERDRSAAGMHVGARAVAMAMPAGGAVDAAAFVAVTAAPQHAGLRAGTAHGCGGGGLLCSVMSMACAMTAAVFVWLLLPPRQGGTLHLLARLLALTARPRGGMRWPRPPSLAALQISRI